MKKLLVLVIEPSVNLHLENLRDRLKSNNLLTQIYGRFDTKFGKDNFNFNKFNVRRFLDVIPNILKAKKVIKELVILRVG